MIAPGASADVPAADADPEAGLERLADPKANLPLILNGGRTVRNTL